MTMLTKADKLFRIARIIVVVGVIIAAYTIIEPSFWRGFGEEEFVMLVLFCGVFDSSLLYCEAYLICRKLPDVTEAGEPLWFRRLFMAAFSPLAMIGAFGLINGVTEWITLFSEGQFGANVLLGVIAALIFLLLVPVIPSANLVIILYLYRRHKRKKNIMLPQI